MKTYRAPWGKALIVISSLLVFLSCVSVMVWPVMFRSEDGIILQFTQWLLPVIVLGCLPFMIRSYTITEEAILIQRLFWMTHLDLAGLKAAEFVPKAMNKSLRTCGNGGVFSFTGWYWNKSLGFYRAYVTDLNRTVVLRFGKRTVVISPDRSEEFVVKLNRVITAGDGR